MNRREFLGCCKATGMTIGLSGIVSCLSSGVSFSSEDKVQLSGLMIADAHAHPYRLHRSRKYGGFTPTLDYDESTPTLEMMKQGGIVASSFSAVGDMVKYRSISGMPYNNTMVQLRNVKNFEKEKKVLLIRKTSDIPSSNGPNGAPGAIMAIEGGDALEGKMRNLDKFADYGVRMITLLHNHNNEIGFSQRSQSDGPLTPFGIQVVERMNELGMMIDVAHSKTQTLKSIVGVSAAPLIDSHTNPSTWFSHPTRFRSWNEMELVAKTGGMICTWPLASPTRNTLKHWAEEIVEIKKRLGINHVGLGTDGGGNLPQKIKGWESILSLPK